MSRARFGDFDLTKIGPEDVVRYANTTRAKSISWTYNEPTIWHEFTTLASKAAHRVGLMTCYVTNGYIEEDPLRELQGVIDAMNIDVKGFTGKFYKEICGGKLEPVLTACEVAVEIGIHVELTYLIIPGYNDTQPEIEEFCKWSVTKLGPQIPVHFSAFHPDYKLTSVPATPSGTLDMAYDIAKSKGIKFVYLGNVSAGEKDDTFCPNCGSRVVEREGFWVHSTNLRGNKCGNCGADLYLVV